VALYVNGVSQATADATELDGIPADLQPAGAGEDGHVVTYVHASGDLELKPGGGGGMTNPMTAVGNLIVGGAVVGGIATPAPLAIGTNGYVLRSVAGTPAWREISAAGTAAARPTPAAAVREGQTYWSTNAAAGLELSICLHKGGATYAWETLAYGVTATGAALVQAADVPAQRTALGLGGAALLNVGTGAGDVASGTAPAAAQAAAIAAAAIDATTKANAAQAAAAAYTDGVSAGTEGVAANYTDSVAVVTLASAAVDATTKANAAQAAAIAAAAVDATTKANAAVVSATATAAADATTKANAAAAASLAKSGGTMSGAIAMGTSKITGLGQATAASEALAAPVGISNGSLLYWISGTLSSLAPGSPYMIPRIVAAGNAIEWVAGSTALGVVPSLIPLCDYAVCAGPLTAVGRLRFDPGAWSKAATGYTTVLTLRLLGDVSGAFTGTFTLYNVTAATTDATLTATEAVPTTKSAVLALPAVATVYELRAAHNGTPVTDYATVSGAVIEVSWSV
jgi:hypothetical protein